MLKVSAQLLRQSKPCAELREVSLNRILKYFGSGSGTAIYYGSVLILILTGHFCGHWKKIIRSNRYSVGGKSLKFYLFKKVIKLSSKFYWNLYSKNPGQEDQLIRVRIHQIRNTGFNQGLNQGFPKGSALQNKMTSAKKPIFFLYYK